MQHTRLHLTNAEEKKSFNVIVFKIWNVHETKIDSGIGTFKIGSVPFLQLTSRIPSSGKTQT